MTAMRYVDTIRPYPGAVYRRGRDGGRKGGVIVKSLEREVAFAERAGGVTIADKEASLRRAEAAHEEKPVAEKPKASEEIVIEEINIDGMCGVY